MWSNGPGIQPHSLEERQQQFNELLTHLAIPISLSSVEKMSRLRSTSMRELVDANEKMQLHEFRAVTDNDFVYKDLFRNINDGDFANRMLKRGVELIMGECRDEHFVYEAWRTPTTESYRAIFDRLQGDYPLAVVRVLMDFYSPDQRLPRGAKNWADAFGQIYADTQIYNLERGFVDCLTKHGAGHLVHRYRVEWRAKCCDVSWPPEWGVTHGTDIVIWLWGEGRGDGLLEKERPLVKKFVHDAFVEFVRGKKKINGMWGTNGPNEVRMIKPDGETVIWKDEKWDKGLAMWKKLREAGCFGHDIDRARL